MTRDPWPVKSETVSRRGFFRLAIGGIAAATAVRTFPFRVYSFASQSRLIEVQQNFSLVFDPTVQKFMFRTIEIRPEDIATSPSELALLKKLRERNPLPTIGFRFDLPDPSHREVK